MSNVICPQNALLPPCQWVSGLAGEQGPRGWRGRTRCLPHPIAPAERAPWGRSFHCSPLLLQTVVVCSSLSCSFCPPRIPLLWTEQGWDDAKTCAGQLELELAAQVLQFLGPVGRGVSHSFTLCSLFCSSSLLRDLLPFSSPQGFVFGFFFFFFSLSAFLCGWSWQE